MRIRTTVVAADSPPPPDDERERSGGWVAKAVFAAIAVVLVALTWWLLAGNADAPIPEPPAPAPAVPAPAASATSTPRWTGDSMMSGEQRDAFVAEYSASVFAVAATRRDARTGKAGLLASVKPMMTAAAYDAFAQSVSAWDWAGCAATGCQLTGEEISMFPSPDAPEDQASYHVVLQIRSGDPGTGPIVGQVEMRIDMEQASPNKPWKVARVIPVTR